MLEGSIGFAFADGTNEILRQWRDHNSAMINLGLKGCKLFVFEAMHMANTAALQRTVSHVVINMKGWFIKFQTVVNWCSTGDFDDACFVITTAVYKYGREVWYSSNMNEVDCSFICRYVKWSVVDFDHDEISAIGSFTVINPGLQLTIIFNYD